MLVEIDWFGGRKACRVVGKEVYAASGKVPAGTRVFVRAETPAAAEWLDGAARLLAEWGYRTGDEAAPAEPAPPGRDAGGLFAGR